MLPQRRKRRRAYAILEAATLPATFSVASSRQQSVSCRRHHLPLSVSQSPCHRAIDSRSSREHFHSNPLFLTLTHSSHTMTYPPLPSHADL